MSDLAGRFSIHRTTVSQHVRARGVTTRANLRKLTDQDLPVITARYAAGQSTATIAADYHIDPTTIANELRRAGQEVRPRRGG